MPLSELSPNAMPSSSLSSVPSTRKKRRDATSTAAAASSPSRTTATPRRSRARGIVGSRSSAHHHGGRNDDDEIALLKARLAAAEAETERWRDIATTRQGTIDAIESRVVRFEEDGRKRRAQPSAPRTAAEEEEGALHLARDVRRLIRSCQTKDDEDGGREADDVASPASSFRMEHDEARRMKDDASEEDLPRAQSSSSISFAPGARYSPGTIIPLAGTDSNEQDEAEAENRLEEADVPPSASAANVSRDDVPEEEIGCYNSVSNDKDDGDEPMDTDTSSPTTVLALDQEQSSARKEEDHDRPVSNETLVGEADTNASAGPVPPEETGREVGESSTSTEQCYDRGNDDYGNQGTEKEDEDEEDDTTLRLYESSPSPKPKKRPLRRSTRRRTLAIQNGTKLLQPHRSSNASTATPPTSSSDGSSSWSLMDRATTSSSSISTFSGGRVATSSSKKNKRIDDNEGDADARRVVVKRREEAAVIDTAHERNGDGGAAEAEKEKEDGSTSGADASKRIKGGEDEDVSDHEEEETAPVKKKPSSAAKREKKKKKEKKVALRRSQRRRRTFAYVNGTNLLESDPQPTTAAVDEEDDAVSSSAAAAVSDETAIAATKEGGDDATEDSAVAAETEGRDLNGDDESGETEKPAFKMHFDVDDDDEPPSTSKRSKPVESSSRPASAGRPPRQPGRRGRSRRKSILPERFRDDDVVMEYTPIRGGPSADDGTVASGRAAEAAATGNAGGQTDDPMATERQTPSDRSAERKHKASSSTKRTKPSSSSSGLVLTEEDDDVPTTSKARQPKRRRKSIHVAGLTIDDMEGLTRESRRRSVCASSSRRRKSLLPTDSLQRLNRAGAAQSEVEKSWCGSSKVDDDDAHGGSGSDDAIMKSALSENVVDSGGRSNDAHETSETGEDYGEEEHTADAAVSNLDQALLDESRQDDREEDVDDATGGDNVQLEDDNRNDGAHDDGLPEGGYEAERAASQEAPVSMRMEENTVVQHLIPSIIPLANEIDKRMLELFPVEEIKALPCASARLFACVSLLVEREMKATSDGSLFAERFELVIPLLKALVRAELTASESMEPEEPMSPLSDSEGVVSDNSQRKIHFCTFDYSSAVTPVDSRMGSNRLIEESIDSLHAVVQEIDDILAKAQGETNNGSNRKVDLDLCLRSVISCLSTIEDSELIREECSMTMPIDWPSARFTKASEMYRMEFEGIVASLSANSEDRIESHLKTRLGDFIGRAIRFYLRRFFNPVPPTLTTPSDENPEKDLSSVRSRVHELLEMTVGEGDERDSAAADGSISSVFSYALQRISEFFQMNEERTGEDDSSSYMSSFCMSEVSTRGLETRGRPIPLTDDDMKDILSDIHETNIVIAGVRACKFVRELMHWPGVATEVLNAGGWEPVEGYARIFSDVGLGQACPEEAHFCLLEDFKGFLRRLDRDASAMDALDQACNESLERLWKRFRCGTRSKEVLQRHPQIKVIGKHIKAAKKQRQSFPSFTG